MAIRWEQVFIAAMILHVTATGLFYLGQLAFHHHRVNTYDGTWCMTLGSDNTPQFRYGKAQCGL